ncbi:MAG: hypothetical protein Q8P67_09925 [archaeon]|nr:hypothetical protein [archaeon]
MLSSPLNLQTRKYISITGFIFPSSAEPTVVPATPLAASLSHCTWDAPLHALRAQPSLRSKPMNQSQSAPTHVNQFSPEQN